VWELLSGVLSLAQQKEIPRPLERKIKEQNLTVPKLNSGDMLAGLSTDKSASKLTRL